MKKLTALLLALMMVFAFAACGGSSEEAETEPETTTTAETTAETTTEAAAVNTVSGTVEDVSGGKVTVKTQANEKLTFNIENASVKADGDIRKGDLITIEYEGEVADGDTSDCSVMNVEVKAAAAETTEATTKEVTIKAVNETVWASSTVNVRADSSTSAEKVGTIKKGEKLTRTGVLSNGWSRVSYNGKDRYISSDFLTTKNPVKEETKTKATESKTKATEAKTKATETKTKATESKTKATETKTKATESQTQTEATETESQTEATETESQTEATETESQTEATETETETVSETEEETEPATVTAKGVITEVGSNSLILDDDVEYNIKAAELDGIDQTNAVGMEVVVEYYEDTHDAVHVYPAVDAGKALVGDSGGLGALPTIMIILALLAIAVAISAVVIRSRRKNATK